MVAVSPSSRRAWIEISPYLAAPAAAAVALLAEGVDRNLLLHVQQRRSGVALLAEGVDRNLEDEAAKAAQEASPSSRRAWIEIPSS